MFLQGMKRKWIGRTFASCSLRSHVSAALKGSGSASAAGNYTLVKGGEKIGRMKNEEYKWQSDLWGWLKPLEERTSSHHTLHGHIHEVRGRLKSMMQCPHILRACWKHDSSVQSLTQVCLFCTYITAPQEKHQKKKRINRGHIHLNHSKIS